MERCETRVDGVTVRYGVVGEGPPLLLIHGWINDHTVWRGLWDRLQRHYRCLLIDLPGFGESDKPSPHVYAYDVMALVRAAVAVLDQERADRAHVCGHSMGGAVGLVLAATYPARVARLVVADAAAYPSPLTVKSALARAPILGPFIFKYLYRRHAVYDFLRNEAYSGHATVDMQVLEHLYELFDPMPAREAAYATLRRILNVPEEVQRRIPQVRAPTLVLWGEDDQLISLDNGRKLARELADARLHVMRGACHVCVEEFPDAAAELIRDHLVGAPAETAAG